jgi:hypothetical protein
VLDVGIDLRVGLWECVVELVRSSVWPCGHARRGDLVPMLLAGLRDSATEVRLSVHASAITAVTGSVDLTLDDWAALADALRATLDAPPPQNGVREEVVAHAEGIRSGIKAAAMAVDVLRRVQAFAPQEDQPGISKVIATIEAGATAAAARQSKANCEL